LTEINKRRLHWMQSTPDAPTRGAVIKWRLAMFVSGVIGTGSLVVVLVLLFIGGLALAVVDKKADARREH
jgi:hypothetical protein